MENVGPSGPLVYTVSRYCCFALLLQRFRCNPRTTALAAMLNSAATISATAPLRTLSVLVAPLGQLS